MSAELDVEALLEAPFEKKEQTKDNSTDSTSKNTNGTPALSEPGDSSKKLESKSKRRHGSRSRSKSPRRKSSPRRRSRSPRRKSRSPRRRSRSPRRRSRSPRRRSRSPRRRSRSPRRRSRSPRRRSRSPRARSPKKSPRARTPPRAKTPPRAVRSSSPELTTEDRDARTVVCMQLARDVTPRDIMDFFNKEAGKVRDVRIIADRRAARRTKGIAYVEFYEIESVPKALLMTGLRLLGAPMMVMPTQAEKNRLAALKSKAEMGPKRITLANLSPAITREQLLMVFEPFGKIKECQVFPSADSNMPSSGIIFFDQADAAQMACEQLNNFFLIDRPMRLNLAADVGPVSIGERDDSAHTSSSGHSGLTNKQAASAAGPAPMAAIAAPIIVPATSRFLLLRHMFNPADETDEDWELDIRDEVLEECTKKHGPVVHMFVDKNSQGCVYIKFVSPEGAASAQASLHGRFFSGRQVIAEFQTEVVYVAKFPETAGLEKVLEVE